MIKNSEELENIFDYKSGLDIEVKIFKSIFCFPHTDETLDGVKNGNRLSSCLCVYFDMLYGLALRGFLQGLLLLCYDMLWYDMLWYVMLCYDVLW